MEEEKKLVTILVPAYNEQEVLNMLYDRLKKLMDENTKYDFEILIVNDGSKDNSLKIMQELREKDKRINYLSLSRNFGKETAMIAGLDYSKGDAVIIIDADLQDDVNAIPKMVEKYYEGYDVVYGVRNSRKTDTFFKRRTALAFYSMMEKMGVNLVPDSADYRLLSKRATEGLLAFKERNLFLRGMVPLVGYKSTKVYYARKERFAGESKYPLSKMLHFALDGITSFSIAPIHLILYLGLLTVAVSIICMIYVLVEKCMGHVVSGWSSLMISIWLLGGIQLISISVIGEYIGKIFSEVKHRPRYTIEEENYTDKFNHRKNK